ncbi:hypothetical protein, partial [Escherichia coli]
KGYVLEAQDDELSR